MATTPAGWEGIFEDGESVLWQGRPRGGVIWSDLLRFETFFGLFFAGFAVFWIVGAATMGRMTHSGSSFDLMGTLFPLFGIPFVGSLALILGGVLLFVLALVILGYLISTVSRTQMQAMQITFFFFLPSLMLSGFMFPYRGMPAWAQSLGEIFPLTHFLRLIRSVMLKGADAAEVADSLAILTLFVLVFSLVALLRFRRTLD